MEILPAINAINIPISRENFDCFSNKIEKVNAGTRFPGSTLVTIDTEKNSLEGFNDFLDYIATRDSNVINDEIFHELRDSRYLKFWPISSGKQNYLNISNK